MDRLDLIESRWREAGCGDADKAWLLEECKRLRNVNIQTRLLIAESMLRVAELASREVAHG